MIRVGIYGYGNLGKGVESAIKQNDDIKLVAIFTRRKPEDVQIVTKGIKVYNADQVLDFKDEIDVMILCGGSATDLPTQSVELVKNFNIIDSFDTHANINKHYANVNKEAEISGKIGIISVGWDPGLFSLNRLYANAILPKGETYTFWGKGVSQGHSDAIRRINGVLDAKQYTIPVEKTLQEVRKGNNPTLSTKDKHIRECYVVVKEGADKIRIAKEITNMPNYFADYDTVVHFISSEELKKNHNGMPHGGIVIRTGKTGQDNEMNNTIEYNIKLDSNPMFTGSILVAYARAAYRLNKEGNKGCKTVFDIAPIYLINQTKKELISQLL